MNKSKVWTILGREVGTATGWDHLDTFVIQLIDFQANPASKLPSGEFVSFDFEQGFATVWKENGTEKETVDIIEAIAALPKV